MARQRSSRGRGRGRGGHYGPMALPSEATAVFNARKAQAERDEAAAALLGPNRQSAVGSIVSSVQDRARGASVTQRGGRGRGGRGGRWAQHSRAASAMASEEPLADDEGSEEDSEEEGSGLEPLGRAAASGGRGRGWGVSGGQQRRAASALASAGLQLSMLPDDEEEHAMEEDEEDKRPSKRRNTRPSRQSRQSRGNKPPLRRRGGGSTTVSPSRSLPSRWREHHGKSQ